MRILIIDNSIVPEFWGSPDLRRLARMATNSTIHVRRAPQEDLPKNPANFDRVILSGSKTSALDESPWVHKLMGFIRQTVDLNIPFLGVCYGHQILARALGGKEFVRKADRAEFGWTQIEITDSSSLTRGMPNAFYSFSAHYDEVSQLPKGMRLLARSHQCGIQACQLEDRPIFGIQFHPEKSASEASLILKKLEEEKTSPPLINSTRTDELYNPKWGEMIFQNFLQI